MNRLHNKIALITGAANGIGAAMAKLFHDEGARLILTDVDTDKGLTLKDSLDKRAEFITLNVSNETNWRKVHTHIKEKYGYLDILVNNAGISGYQQTSGPHNPENFNLQSWQEIHAINLEGVALGCKYAIRLMKKNRSGSILNLSSRFGSIGSARLSAYAASKAAVKNHTKSVALYCAEKKYNIRCNSLHPGFILTPIWDPLLGGDEQKLSAMESLSAHIPLGCLGKPEDVANTALFLASDESAYITGTEINIDGGLSAGDFLSS